ncbi:MAG: hypothetical protein KAW92_11870 [Candidatus Cloacimonetes bacterium]|nr:hypothetical protein [Candidatus Cloacimonadota bacterium]
MATSFGTFIRKLRNFVTKYYTVYYSDDTHLYYVLQIYAGELASGSVHLEEIHENLSIDTASTRKLYDNFGTYFGQSKYFYQNVDEDLYVTLTSNGSGSISSYRKNIDFLMQAAMTGGTINAIKRVGHAFTLITPDIREYYLLPRWKLKTDTGTISDSSTNPYYITDTDKEWMKNEWNGALLLESGSADLSQILTNYYDDKWWDNLLVYYPITSPPHSFSISGSYTLTFSKLGTNTRLYDRYEEKFAADIIIWLPTPQEDRQEAIEKALIDTKPAHVDLRIYYENYYVAQTTTDQLSSGSSGSFPYLSYDPNVFDVSLGAVTNLVPTIDSSFSGSTTSVVVPGTNGFVKSSGAIVNNIYTSPVLDLDESGLIYGNYDWAYDWVPHLIRDCRILVEARSGNALPLVGSWDEVEAGESIYKSNVERYYQYRVHVFTWFSSSFALHQFSMKAYESGSSNPYYTSIF